MLVSLVEVLRCRRVAVALPSRGVWPDDSVEELLQIRVLNGGGKLAQVGARLIDGVAKKMAEQFFTAFNKRASGNTSG